MEISVHSYEEVAQESFSFSVVINQFRIDKPKMFEFYNEIGLVWQTILKQVDRNDQMRAYLKELRSGLAMYINSTTIWRQRKSKENKIK